MSLGLLAYCATSVCHTQHSLPRSPATVHRRRSWSRSKKCQLANFKAMRKRGLQPSGTYIHVPRGPPSRAIHAAAGNGCLLCVCLGCQAAAAGGLLHRRDPQSEVEHVLYRRTSCGWMRQACLRRRRANSKQRCRPTGEGASGHLGSQVRSHSFCWLFIFLFFLLWFCLCRRKRADRRRPVCHCPLQAQRLVSLVNECSYEPDAGYT